MDYYVGREIIYIHVDRTSIRHDSLFSFNNGFDQPLGMIA